MEVQSSYKPSDDLVQSFSRLCVRHLCSFLLSLAYLSAHLGEFPGERRMEPRRQCTHGEDGRIETLVSDSEWKPSKSQLLMGFMLHDSLLCCGTRCDNPSASLARTYLTRH